MSLALQDISHDGLTRPRSQDMALANKVIVRGHDACMLGAANIEQGRVTALLTRAHTMSRGLAAA